MANEPAAIQAVDVVFFRFSKKEEEKDYRRRRWKDFERLEWIRFWKFLKKIRTLERDGSKILKSWNTRAKTKDFSFCNWL